MGIVKGNSDKMSLKQRFTKLRDDLKGMTLKEKVEHIWTYYNYMMLAVLCILMIVGGLLYGMIASQPELHIGGIQCNMELTVEGYDYLTKDFQKNVLKEEEGTSNLNTFWFYGEYTVDAMSDTYQAHNSVTAYVETDMLDYMLVDLYSFRYFAGDRLFMDLNEILTEEELQELDAHGLLLYDEDVTTNTKTPRAVNIIDSAFIQDNSQAAECYLVFIRNTTRKENCRKLWDHIVNYNGNSFPNPETVYTSGAQCNIEIRPDIKNQFRDQLRPEEGVGHSVLYSYRLSTDDETEAQKTYEQIRNDAKAGKLDYLLLDRHSYDKFAADHIYADLRQILTEEELTKLESDGMLLFTEMESGEQIPYAINITNTDFCNGTECYLVFISTDSQSDTYVQIWEQIYNYKGVE